MMWPFKRKPEPEWKPWGEFVRTHLLPIARAHGITVHEMSWEEATSGNEGLVEGTDFDKKPPTAKGGDE